MFRGWSGSSQTYTCIKLIKHFKAKRYMPCTFLLCLTCQFINLYSNLERLNDKDKSRRIKKMYKVEHCPHTLTLQQKSLQKFRRKGSQDMRLCHWPWTRFETVFEWESNMLTRVVIKHRHIPLNIVLLVQFGSRFHIWFVWHHTVCCVEDRDKTQPKQIYVTGLVQK